MHIDPMQLANFQEEINNDLELDELKVIEMQKIIDLQKLAQGPNGENHSLIGQTCEQDNIKGNITIYVNESHGAKSPHSKITAHPMERQCFIHWFKSPITIEQRFFLVRDHLPCEGKLSYPGSIEDEHFDVLKKQK